jgi:hypothetical protein
LNHDTQILDTIENIENIIPEDNQELTPEELLDRDEFIKQITRNYDEKAGIIGYRNLLEAGIAKELKKVTDLSSPNDMEDLLADVWLYLYKSYPHKFKPTDKARMTVRLFKLASKFGRFYACKLIRRYKVRLKNEHIFGRAKDSKFESKDEQDDYASEYDYY